jgi:hypothetical protein
MRSDYGVICWRRFKVHRARASNKMVDLHSVNGAPAFHAIAARVFMFPRYSRYDSLKSSTMYGSDVAICVWVDEISVPIGRHQVATTSQNSVYVACTSFNISHCIERHAYDQCALCDQLLLRYVISSSN